MNFDELDPILSAHGAERVWRSLEPYLTQARKEKIEHVLSGRIESIRVAVERPEDPRNAAAVVRTAEALGILHVHTIEAPDRCLHARHTTQGAYHWLHTHHHPDRSAFLSCLRAQRVRLAGALMDGDLAVDELPVDAPLCVVFGNEGVGLSPELLGACELTFRVPMAGMSESLNLSVSAAITLYDTSRALRRRLGRAGDLEGDRLHALRARYYARSLEPRLLAGLFPP